MREWLARALALLAENPAAQGTVAALATFILEDPTTIGCGLLVAESKMSFATALIGVASGIAIGDIGLYAAGRWLGPRAIGRGPLTASRHRRAARWFDRNLALAVVVSRFIPGMRLPTYVGAGVLRAPFGRFVAIAVAASLVWTLLLLQLTVVLGEQVLPLLGDLRWPTALVALLLVVLLQRKAASVLDRDESADESPVLSAFELWPPVLFYLPVVFYWMWLALRFRGLTLPTAANPSIFAGGFIGESKSQILGLVAPEHAHRVAPWVCIEIEADRDTDCALEKALDAMDARGIGFPVVAKPDIGQRGDGVRPVAGEAALAGYLRGFPPGQRLMLQALVKTSEPEQPVTSPSAPLADAREAGVLYWRRPGRDLGQIFSITLKLFPEIVGDGRRTLRELITGDPRAGRMRGIYLNRLGPEADQIPANGERKPLVFAGNHCQGTIFRDGTDLQTPELLTVIHETALAMPEFYFGRFDLRFSSLERFLQGRDFTIVEINGASAEATHIWDSRMDLASAYATLFQQFRILFEIGATNRARGHQPLGTVPFLREALRYRRVSRHYPSTE